MKDNIKKIISVSLVTSLAVFAGCSSDNLPTGASSFEDCEKKGGNIAESFPRQCFIGDMAFVEKIDNTIDPIDTENGYGNDNKFAPGHILVGFESVKTYESVILEIEKLEDVNLDKLIFDQPSLKIAKFNVPEGMEKDLVEKITAISGVEYAELDNIVTIDPIIDPIPVEPEENYRGEIISIQDGTDGSTVTLKLDYPIVVGLGSESKEITEIKATLSIPNLGPDSGFNFSDIKVGNKLSVTGQAFNVGNEKYLTANFAFTLFSLDAKSICDEREGNYEKGGILGAYHCNVPAKDAGKVCSSSEQCEGLCLDTGVCSVKTVNFGCTAILENGQNVTICID